VDGGARASARDDDDGGGGGGGGEQCGNALHDAIVLFGGGLYDGKKSV
jgi:hypothetical protein